MGSFHRVDTSKLMRGAARLLYAPIATTKPLKISDVIELEDDANQVTSLAQATPTPASGTFSLTIQVGTGAPETTATIVYNAASGAVQTAIEALASVGAGNVTCSGGPLPGTPVQITFAGALAATPVTVTVATQPTGGTYAASSTTPGRNQYSPKTGWYDLGGTREGIQIEINNSEDSYDVDQIPGEVGSAPTDWECGVSTRLAEMTLERFAFTWEGPAITTDITPTIPERETGGAGAVTYTQRRLAVLFKRPNGAILAFMFHKVQRSPQAVSLDFRKSGEAMTLPIRFKVLADETEADPKYQFYRVREQDVS